MAYGTVKVDTVTFTYASGDTSTTFSGIYASITNNLTLSGTATAATFTGTTANFTNVNAQNISVTTSLSGLAITGGTAGFTTITGTTVTGTTANFVTVSGTTVTGTTANFVTVSGTTVTGNTGQFTNLAGAAAGFTTVTGTTVTGTTANFVTVSGTSITGGTAGFTTVTGTTVTGTTANFVTLSGTTVTGNIGQFTSLTGATTTMTSGVFALGTAPLPSISFVSDPNTGIYSPGADQLAVATSGTGRLFVDASGNVGVNTASPSTYGKFTVVDTQDGFLSSTFVNTSNGVSAVNRIQIGNDGSNGAGQLVVYGAQHSTLANIFDVNNANPAALRLLTNNTERARIRSDGTFEIKGAGTAGSSPGFSVNPSTPANSFVIDSSGRLGIGTSSPTEAVLVVNNPNGSTDNGATGNTIFVKAATVNSNLVRFSGAVTTDLLVGRFGATDNISIGTTSGTTIATFKSDGKVGIGTTSPAQELHVQASSGSGNIRVGGSAGLEINLDTSGYTTSQIKSLYSTTNAAAQLKLVSGYLTFHTGTSNLEKMQLDASGRLLVGTSTSLGAIPGQAVQNFQVAGSTNGGISMHTFSADAFACNLEFRKSRSATTGVNTIVQSGDTLGKFYYCGSDGTTFIPSASIEAFVDGTPGANDMPGRLVFSTTADGGSSPTERMRIDSTGVVTIGQGAWTPNTGYFQLTPKITSGTGSYYFYDNSDGLFPYPDNTQKLGNPAYRWTTVYATTALINTSDANTKQQIRTLSDAEKAVAQSIKGLIRAYKFNDSVAEKGDGARIHVGVIAQDVQAAFVAEGLDASKYSLFCSDTWYEVDGEASSEDEGFYTKDTPNAIQVSRLGIRYDELLAFVLAVL